MKSVMKHLFSQVPKADIPRSSFDRSHGYKTTFDSGYLVPVFLDEALPGDTFKLNMTQFARLATPIVPFMDNLRCDSFFFAVPYRLLWDNWQKFNGEQTDPGDDTDFLIPYITSTSVTGYAVGSIFDYMGLPTGIPSIQHSALPLRAYNLIWNEWFRDQNIQDSLTVSRTNGPDSPTLYELRRRGKRHDYFTSCLPWPQKGPAVQLPLGETAPVVRVSNADAWNVYNETNNVLANSGSNVFLAIPNTDGIPEAKDGVASVPFSLDPMGGLEADLADATAATINALRQAFQIQKLYERDARGGTRYTEIIRSHFGVVSPDARMQRPEYLGGGSTPITVTPIAQTSNSPATPGTTTPQGNLAAMGIMSASGHGFTKSFTEHCLILGLVSVRADLNYQQGLNRMWSRQTRWDFYWPALSHIGEQAVLNQEIYCVDDGEQNADVFGYQERYAEYRYKPSVITGKFRSTASGSLDIWHLAQEFGSLPELLDGFIEDTPPVSRVVATPDEPEFLYDAYFQLHCARPMPVYGVPGLIDHF